MEASQKRYLTWFTDSSRWEHFVPRGGDIVIATAWKCGTTWTQQIVSLLVFQSPEPRPIWEISPWIDCRFMLSVEDMKRLLEAQTHRRFLKSRLPFDGLPYDERIRYIHVARDGRDLCTSAFNHHLALTAAACDRINRGAAETHGPFPRRAGGLRSYWREWLSRGVQEGETDGYPDLSFFNLEATFWRARHRDHLLLVHYNDLKADLEGEMRRIAAFLEIDTSESLWPALIEAAGFDAMKANGAVLMRGGAENFEGGSDRFLYRGTNGRWRDELTSDDLAIYDRVASRMTPGLASWIERGRREAGDPRSLPD